MRKISIILLVLLAATALISCSTSNKVIRETYIRDTIISIDTTLIIKADTVKSIYPCRDTIIIKETERVKLITKVKDGIVYTVCEAKPDEITIKKDKLVQVVKSIYQSEKKPQDNSVWVPLSLILLAIVIILVLARRLI